MQRVLIYCLICPLTLKVRYIGRTKVSLPMRLSQHVFKAKRNVDNTHKSNWIRSLLKINSKPFIRTLCVVDGWEESYKKERELINKYKHRLLNHNDRGEGNNAPKSDAQKQKLSKIMRENYTDKGKALHEKKVYVYDIHGKYICDYPSCKKAAADLGIYYKSISKVTCGVYKQMKGYQFSFEKKDMPDLSSNERIMRKLKK